VGGPRHAPARRGHGALSIAVLVVLSAIPSALVHTYASPAIARLLTQTGRLTTVAPRRLAETGMWAGRPRCRGLLRGAPGYQATVQVRLLHARMRSSALKHGWDTAEGAFQSARWMWPAHGWTSP